MEHETEDEGFIEPVDCILPTNAKDLCGLYGLSAEIMRSYLKHGMAEDLRYHFGINEDEARLTLRCADLASLPVWDADAMLDAATLWSWHEKAMGGNEESIEDAAEMESMRRRIRLALLAENAPNVMRPAEAVLLLQRAGISFFFELLQAIDSSHYDSIPPTAPTGTPESDERPAFRPRIGWQIAMFDAWPAMKKLHGRDPIPAEAIKYLKQHDDSGDILKKGAATELWWKPRRGQSREVAFSTVENTISEWRTKGVLPA